MSDITWTPEELAEFDKLINQLSSPGQLVRLATRLTDMPKFIATHGKEKCDAMWAHLEGDKK